MGLLLLAFQEELRKGLTSTQQMMLIGILLYLVRYCSATTCYLNNDKSLPRTCITSPVNAANNRKVDATNTCGTPTPEGYCYIGPQRKCEICDASNPAQAHPITNINDAFSLTKITWWQSKTWWTCNQQQLAQMFDPLKVNITLDIEKRYLISGGIYVTFYTERPKKMVIERSNNFGVTWEVYQYYAKNCRSAYNMLPDPTVNPADPFKPICSQLYSGEFPRSGGVVHFDPRSRYTPGQYYNKEVDRYLQATNIRLRLEYPGTDGREYINDEATLNQYYYAISDLRVDARCSCHGHAEYCDIDAQGREVCDCQHYTTGDDCNTCLPMYQNRPWMAGNATNANPCQKCNCNDHATSCVYNAFLGTGICENCQHNTRGIRCDQCIEGYYRNITRQLNELDVCIPCDCYKPGIIDDGKCAQSTHGGVLLGQCNCKAGIFGRRCDQCMPGKWGYLAIPEGTCFDCACNELGTLDGHVKVCDPYNGQCTCKAFTTGRQCDNCRPGYYQFPTNTNGNSDCLSCPCNVGGAFPLCDRVTGACQCKPGVKEAKCGTVKPGFYFPNVTYAYTEPELSDANGSFSKYFLARNYARYFTGHGFLRLDPGQSMSFKFTVPTTAKFFGLIRYSLFQLDWYSTILPRGRENVDWAGSEDINHYLKPTDRANQWLFTGNIISPDGVVVQSISFNVADLTMGNANFIVTPSSVDLKASETYTFALFYEESSKMHGSPWPLLVDSLSLTLDYTGTTYYQMQLLTGVQQEIVYCFDASRELATTYNLPAYCEPHIFTIDLEIYGKALECNCLRAGSYNWNDCVAFGGQCQCKEGYGTRACDLCIPGYYGNPGLACKPCQCSTVGSLSATCHGVTGQCLCKENAHGLKCDECKMGFYHLDPTNPKGCQECFGYGHHVSCVSALGFVKHHVETEFDNMGIGFDGWTLRNPDSFDVTNLLIRGTQGLQYTDDQGIKRYFRAPPLFLGDKLYSYGQLLEVDLGMFSLTDKLASGVNWHVRLIGNNGQIALFKFMEGISRARSRYSVTLHQDYMVNTTKMSEFDFKAMLGQLEALDIGVCYFVNPVTLTLKSVRLNTAKFEPTNTDVSVMVNYVERATCYTPFTGNSCEFCNVGYTRVIPNGGPLVNCVPCACNGRTNKCDPQTGVCINCRAGTMGKYCEKCMKNVLEPDCDRCEPGYWGLYSQVNGCRPCDCYLPGTEGGNNNECDSLSGQCVCDAFKNVGGRQCNLCKENSFNISLSEKLRCQECPVCYGLIEDSVLMLRRDILQVQIEIRGMVVTISNMQITPFYQAITAMHTDITLLTQKANGGMALVKALDNLWRSLEERIDLFLETLTGTTTDKMQLLLTDVNAIFDSHNTTVFQYSFIHQHLIDTYNLLNNTVRARMAQQGIALKQLQFLGNEMSGYVATATNNANHVLTKKYDLKQKIQMSITAAQHACEAANQTRAHALNLTSSFAPVYVRGLNVQAYADGCVVSIQTWLTNATKTLIYAEHVFHLVSVTLEDYKANITSLNLVTQNLRGHFNKFTTDIFTLTTNVNAIALEITKLKTSLHHTQISSIERRSSLLLTNLILLENKTQIAAQQAANIKQEATSMLNTVQNFMVVAAQAKQAANEALTKVDAVRSSVEMALNTAVTISNQIKGPKTTAATSLQVMNAASFTAAHEISIIETLHEQALSVGNQTSDAISFIKNEQISLYIQHNLSPLLDQCENYRARTSAALASAQNARAQSQQAHESARQTANQITMLSTHISNLQTIQVDQLDALIAAAQRVRGVYGAMNLEASLLSVRTAIEAQKQKIQGYREKNKHLAMGIERFKTLYTSLARMSC